MKQKTSYTLLLWYAHSSDFSIRNLTRFCTLCYWTFLLVHFFCRIWRPSWFRWFCLPPVSNRFFMHLMQAFCLQKVQLLRKHYHVVQLLARGDEVCLIVKTVRLRPIVCSVPQVPIPNGNIDRQNICVLQIRKIWQLLLLSHRIVLLGL